MPYSLWRNGEHLGDVVLPLPTSDLRPSVFGVFVPTAAFDDIAPIMQVRPPFIPGSPVFETSLLGPSTPGPIALTPMSAEEAKGIPPARILELRDPDGLAQLVQMLTLRRLDATPGKHPNVVAAACADAQVPYSEWYLHAAVAAPADAREV